MSSHLSTIIDRVNRRVQTFGEPNVYTEPLFEQAVINLMEYIEAWTDAEPDEIKTAKELYDKYRPKLKGNLIGSHKVRLQKADEQRAKLGK